MSNLIQRTLSGAIYVAVVVVSIMVHPIAFAALFAVVSTLAVREFHIITGDERYTKVFGMLLNLLLFVGVGVWQYCDRLIATNLVFETSLAQLITFAYAIVLLVALVCELAHYEAAQPAAHWGNLLAGQVMIALPFATMLIVMAYSKWLLLALFVLLWTNDTGAYCVGMLTAKRKNGNHKMSPHISPKKSWEGLIGGAVFVLLAAWLLTYCGWFDCIDGWQYVVRPHAKYMVALGFGLLATCAGTLGDLMESLLKRSYGIKDSGRFLPGHGGVLDRFDSLLLATPVIAMFLTLIRMFI
ncbi:MAG: phosphatidate cytidylyltransferase [Paludibacteraceae bacterium]|nr:phosphatidate cytidylyltransferase [Paludibacteraceae bacterium]